MNSFSFKLALITRGRSGIGKEVAVRLMQAGASVVVGGRDEAKLRQAASETDPGSARVRLCAGDIAQPACLLRQDSQRQARGLRGHRLPDKVPGQRILPGDGAGQLHLGAHQSFTPGSAPLQVEAEHNP